MAQTLIELNKIVQEYNTYFLKNEFCPIQKAYSTPHYLVLGVRFPGKSVYLYIGRGHAYCDFQFDHMPPPVFLRVQDKLLDYARKNLVGSMMGKISSLNNQINLIFSFKTEHIENEIFFSYKDRQLFFVKRNKNEIFSSLQGSCTEGRSIENYLNLNHLLDERVFHEKNENSNELSKYFAKEKEKVKGSKIQSKKIKFLQKKINAIKNDIDNVSAWKQIEKDIEQESFIENLSNLNQFEFVIHGHKVKLNSAQNTWLKKNCIYEKIKKLKKAENILRSRYAETEKELELVRLGQFKFEHTRERAIPPLWKTEKNSKIKFEKSGYEIKLFEFQFGRLTGVCGLEARANDWIRKNLSKEFFWFHVENYTGAHCVLKTDDLSQLNDEMWAILGSMLSECSKLTLSEIPIVFSQLKYVKGIKGTAGKVLIKKPKYIRVNFVPWKERITLKV